MKDSCPCCSGKNYNNCCKPYHSETLATDAILLMRSRYSAYSLSLCDYIISTTHLDNPEYKEDINLWKKEILEFCEKTNFEKLEILNFNLDKEISYVTFIAYLSQQKRDISFLEKSTFKKVEGKWLYEKGELL
jgi:SEC-C motif-containing protein